MWDIQILGVDLYHVLFWLILYSFMGWIWESCYVSIKEKKLVNRGLAALQLGEKLEGLQTAMEEFTEYLQTTKVYSSTEEARELFGNYKKHLPTKKEFQEKLGEYQRRIAGKIEEKGLSEYAEGIRSRSKGFREQYQERVSRITGVNKRFMKAYPTIHKVSRKKKGNQKETK